MNAIDFLKSNLHHESTTLFGISDSKTIDFISSAWMDDQNNSRHRFIEIDQFLPNSPMILDMASGCGTFVFYGLLNGYKVYGVEPEKWKNEFNHLKLSENSYDQQWKCHFIQSIGETLPFKTNSFDCVSSFQTLEHVQNVTECLQEMIRITRGGGGLHIRCPDYSSTFEGHYRLPWVPFFYRPLAKLYLKILKRPTAGLNTIQYVTQSQIIKTLHKIGKENGVNLSIIDINRNRFESKLKRLKFPSLFNNGWFLIWFMRYLKNIFVCEVGVALFVYVKKLT